MEENESRDLVDGLTNAFRVTFLVSVLSGSINCYIISVFCVHIILQQSRKRDLCSTVVKNVLGIEKLFCTIRKSMTLKEKLLHFL